MGYKTRALSRDEFSRYIRVILDAPERELPYASVCCIIMGTGARIGEVLAMTEKICSTPGADRCRESPGHWRRSAGKSA